jgi:hypothetical protein
VVKDRPLLKMSALFGREKKNALSLIKENQNTEREREREREREFRRSREICFFYSSTSFSLAGKPERKKNCKKIRERERERESKTEENDWRE